MRRALLALLLLVPLSACSGDGDSTASSTPTSTASAAPSGTLLLRGDGLALVTEQGTQQIPFGSGTSVVAPAIAASLGEPQPLAVRCGAEQVVRDTLGVEGFDVLFDEDRFVGWDDSSGALATEDGLRLGATKAQVQQALPDATFTVSSIGPEFTTPSGLGGFLDGEAPTSTLIGLTGGESCVVR